MAIKKLKSITFPGSEDRYVIPEAPGNLPVLALPSEQIVTFRKITDITEPDVIEEPIYLTSFGHDDNYYYYRLPGFGYCNITYLKNVPTDATWHTVWEGSKSFGGGTTFVASNFNSDVDFTRLTRIYADGSAYASTNGSHTSDYFYNRSIEITAGSGSVYWADEFKSLTGLNYPYGFYWRVGAQITTDNKLTTSIYAAVRTSSNTV